MLRNRSGVLLVVPRVLALVIMAAGQCISFFAVGGVPQLSSDLPVLDPAERVLELTVRNLMQPSEPALDAGHKRWCFGTADRL